LISDIVAQFRLDVPTLHREDIIEFPPEEVDIDVTGDPARFFTSRGPHYVKGTRLRIGVRFEGEAALFRYGSSEFTNPVEGVVDEEECRVILNYDAENPDTDQAKAAF
jgi:hypothetical protein